MGQPGFFDADKRLAALSKKGDPLEAIAALVPWRAFAPPAASPPPRTVLIEPNGEQPPLRPGVEGEPIEERGLSTR